ncbi:MAG: hypothetical protein IT439_00415 [Phycisphaerales bacterium]|nr:hypothetical protein [Phycisphaerales bacterium]
MSGAHPIPATPESPVLASIEPARSGQAITSWLARLETLLDLPAPAAREIIEELDAHLRERSEDLARSGTSEAQAVHMALSELGDVADLAVGYRRAYKANPWRPVMKALLFVAVGSAITLAASALAPGGGVPAGPPSGVRVYTPADGGWHADADAPTTLVSLSVEDLRLEEVLGALATAQGASLHLQRHALDQAGINIDDPLSMSVKNISFTRALAMVNDSLDRHDGDAIDVRIADGIMEIAPRQFFDRRESALAVYDIADLVEEVEPEEVLQLLTSIAEPESWQENGGELAQARLVGGKLFVVAPPRLQGRVSWVLEQLREPVGEDGQGAAPAREVRSFALSHAPAGELSLVVAPLLDLRGVRVTSDARTNSLIVQGSDAQLDSLELLISKLDVAAPAEPPAER